MAVVSSATASGRQPSRFARFEQKWGLLFLAPWIIGFILFFAGPMVASLVMSFTNYNLLQPESMQFIGVDNWLRMLSDPLVGQAALVTGRFLLISTPIHLALPLALALLLNSQHLFGQRVFRTLFYLPMMVPFVAATMIWQGVLNTQQGWLNRFLAAVGIPGPDWLNDPNWVVPALALIGIWGVGNVMVTMLAGLQAVPTDLYEAARVDGANAGQRFTNITLPMVSPVLFYNLVLAIIGGFQYFLQAFVIYRNQPGPDNAALFYMLVLYKEGWSYYQMGYAATLAWAMFVVALAVTIGLFSSARYWVYYAAGEK